MPGETAAPVRLAELVATLSLGTDLGQGTPMEHMIRQCLIALRMSELLGLDESEREVVYYGALLAHVGCHVDAHEQAKWFGDDIKLKGDSLLIDPVGFSAAKSLLGQIGAGRPALERARLGVAFLGDGYRWAWKMLESHWKATEGLAIELGLSQDVRDTLQQSFERWDGKGMGGLKGEELRITARLIHLADVVDVYHGNGGVEAAVEVARARRGTQFDPAVVDLFCAHASMLLADLDAATSWDAVIAAEPSLAVMISEEHFESVLEAIADFVDLKVPHTLGHSRGVADLAAEAARAYGLPEGDVVRLRRAALVHDIGRLGVSNAIWDKPGPLHRSEMERVRLHAYLTERMLAYSPVLAPLGAIAAQHHERLDGSGYPRGLSGDAITPSGRILAAADVYDALRQMRPHRPARSADEAAAELRAEVAAGRLDGDAVNAVLRAAGHRVSARREWPAGLTAREVEVLRLLARGLSNKEIAEHLVITRKTASNHIEHIYSKTGATNRARASLFAVRHGLMADTQPLQLA